MLEAILDAVSTVFSGCPALRLKIRAAQDLTSRERMKEERVIHLARAKCRAAGEGPTTSRAELARCRPLPESCSHQIRMRIRIWLMCREFLKPMPKQTAQAALAIK